MVRGGRLDDRPHLALQRGRLAVNPAKPTGVADRVPQQALRQICGQQPADLRRLRGGQQTGPDILGTDRIRFLLLVVLALIVSIHGHGKAEGNHKGQQRETRAGQRAEVLPFCLPRMRQSPDRTANPDRQPEEQNR
jgi:hypothetical protein